LATGRKARFACPSSEARKPVEIVPGRIGNVHGVLKANPRVEFESLISRVALVKLAEGSTKPTVSPDAVITE
jgi:hypothetical protein